MSKFLVRPGKCTTRGHKRSCRCSSLRLRMLERRDCATRGARGVISSVCSHHFHHQHGMHPRPGLRWRSLSAALSLALLPLFQSEVQRRSLQATADATKPGTRDKAARWHVLMALSYLIPILLSWPHVDHCLETGCRSMSEYAAFNEMLACLLQKSSLTLLALFLPERTPPGLLSMN